MGKYLHYFKSFNTFDNAYNGSAYTEPWVSYTEEKERTIEIEFWDERFSFLYSGYYDCVNESGETAGKWHVWIFDDEGDQFGAATESENPSVGDTVHPVHPIHGDNVINTAITAQIINVLGPKMVDYNQHLDWVFEVPQEEHGLFYENGMDNPDFPEGAKPAIRKMINREPFKIKVTHYSTGIGRTEYYILDENSTWDGDSTSWTCEASKSGQYIEGNNSGIYISWSTPPA